MLLSRDLQPFVQYFFAPLQAKLVIIREAPISNQKHQLLKRRLAGIFDGKSAILRKQLEMLEIVFLDVGSQIIDQH